MSTGATPSLKKPRGPAQTCQGSGVTASRVSRYSVPHQALPICSRSGVPIHGNVRPLGFEPRTCGLRVRCSAIELEALVLSDQGANSQAVASHSVTLGELVERWLSDLAPHRHWRLPRVGLFLG